MNTIRLSRRFWIAYASIFCLATALGLFQMIQSYIWHVYEQRPVPWGQIFIIGLADWYLWVLLVPYILQLTRWLPVDPHTWKRSVFIQVPLGIATCLFMVAVMVPVFQVTRFPERTAIEIYRILFVAHFLFWLLLYVIITGGCYAVTYYGKYRERERQAAQLQAQLTQAQLQMLKMQLHPHFLFNTLNAISCLIHRDVQLADDMLARLGDLLRLTLDNDGSQEVTLRKELDFIKPYLEIEKARLGTRLSVALDIDPATLDALVPNLLLQPLVENAIRHGIAPRTERGWIRLQSRAEAGALRITIEDDGPGLPAEDTLVFKSGIGLANTQARLEQLYGAEHSFELRRGRAGGLLVDLVLPWREELGASEPPSEAATQPHGLAEVFDVAGAAGKHL